MIHYPAFSIFSFTVDMDPNFDLGGIEAHPKLKEAIEWCVDMIAYGEYGYAWTGYTSKDTFRIYFKHEIDVLAFKIKFAL